MNNGYIIRVINTETMEFLDLSYCSNHTEALTKAEQCSKLIMSSSPKSPHIAVTVVDLREVKREITWDNNPIEDLLTAVTNIYPKIRLCVKYTRVSSDSTLKVRMLDREEGQEIRRVDIVINALGVVNNIYYTLATTLCRVIEADKRGLNSIKEVGPSDSDVLTTLVSLMDEYFRLVNLRPDNIPRYLENDPRFDLVK